MTINRLAVFLIGIGLGVFSLGASAKGLTYSYGEIGYSDLDADQFDAKGATARVSIAAMDFIHVKFDYTHFWVDDVKGQSGSDPEIDRFIIGLGGNYSLTKKIDMLGTVSYIHREWSNGTRGPSNKSYDNSDTGYRADAGIRALVFKNLELNAFGSYQDIDDFEASAGGGAGIVYRFYKKFSLSGDVRHYDNADDTEFFVGLRVNF